MSTIFDSAQLISQTPVRSVEVHAELGSTNDRALELTGDAAAELPLLVVAERQLAGRGRGANRWWSESGGLTFSLVISAAAYRLPAQSWPQISLTAGLAVCRLLEAVLSSLRETRSTPENGGDAPVASDIDSPIIGLKWPNDVLVRGRKISGILIESPSGGPGTFVIGVGLNVNNSLDQAPADVRARAASLIDLTGREHDRQELLIALLQELDAELQQLAASPEAVRQEWASRCVLTGKHVDIQSGPRRLEGECLGLADDGALLLQREGIREKVYSGIVLGWR